MNTERELEAVVMSRLKRNWGWLMALGILFVILGMLGVGMSAYVTVFSMYFLAVLLFVAGFSQLADAWHAKEWRCSLWHIAVGLLYMIAAALMSYDPTLASVLITAMLAWTFIFIGISRLVMAFSLFRAPGWLWLLISALSAIALGAIVLAKWPMSGVWFIGLMISIELMISGWTYILLAIAAKKSTSDFG